MLGIVSSLINLACYFNSLLQTYFQNVEFVKTVLAYSTPERYEKDKKPKEEDDAIEFKRKQGSCKLVENMKILFGNMIASDRKYMDPTDVVTSVVDDNGNEIPIGDQKDIGEFNLVFFSRIDEGLELSKKKKKE
jgi:ubiquitin carboxyl-terminal hydrolase 25/28